MIKITGEIVEVIQNMNQIYLIIALIDIGFTIIDVLIDVLKDSIDLITNKDILTQEGMDGNFLLGMLILPEINKKIFVK